MIGRLSAKFNVSIAETGYNDSHEWAQIGFAMTGNDSRIINGKIDKLFNMADDMGLAYIADTTLEIIHF